MLILLDIDGVMVPGASWRPIELLNDGFAKFNNRAVNNLKKIISETNASIILTTSHKSSFSIPQWMDIFKTRGIDTSIKTLSNNINNLSRKDEILNWLRNRTDQEDFVIIDDDTSLNGLPSNIRAKCVLTSPLIGLDESSTLNAIDILKNTHS
jgi:sugar-specific transcriptional regulator TrmB